MTAPRTNADSVSQWDMFEISLDGPSDGNPFIDHTFSARFTRDDESCEAAGFYDGGGVYRVRFMPKATGTWSYRTKSDVPALDGIEGRFEVTSPRPGNHGPVAVAERFHFRYADGTPYKQIGTTCYAWVHQGERLEQQTLETLKSAPFNKMRMCIFPKHYHYNENEPERYAYPLLAKGSSHWERGQQQGNSGGWSFDFERFDPVFFRHLEARIAALAELGIEADLILLHPYDRWGFSTMTPEGNERYLRYVVARLAAFRNVWWSMANEYDLMPQYAMDDWDRFFEIVQEADPHDHLRSIHNCFRFYDHSKPWVTHCSVQRSDLAQTLEWRARYGKPVVVDECCYEGNVAETWGNISGPEMVHRFWEGTANGGYVGHSDSFTHPQDVIWWAKGGVLHGDSAPRLAFLRTILEAGPAKGLEPIPDTRPYEVRMAGGRDITLEQLRRYMAEQREARLRETGKDDAFGGSFAGVHVPHEYYLVYFGLSQPSQVVLNVPEGERYRAHLIDTWGMTMTPCDREVVRGTTLEFDIGPYHALKLERIPEPGCG